MSKNTVSTKDVSENAIIESNPLPPSGAHPPQVAPPAQEADKHWLVRKATVSKLWLYGIGLLLVLTIVGEIIHPHPHFDIENYVGFWSWYGFLAPIAMIVLARCFGYLLKRPDGYYDGELK